MDNEYLLNFLKEKNVPIIQKKRHTYLAYYGLEQQDTYVLKEGVIKTSIILHDGREFNISYINTPDRKRRAYVSLHILSQPYFIGYYNKILTHISSYSFITFINLA